VDPGRELQAARRRAGLTQAQLAERAGTSQATISAYETEAKQPSIATLSRLLAATGARLTVKRGVPVVVRPSQADHARVNRTLLDVLALAEALPTRHESELHFPRLELKAR
jgi:hypothetical protein